MSSLSDILQKLASGQIPTDIPADCECSDQLRELSGYLYDLRHFVGALTSGELNATIKRTGSLAGSLKGLHANLRHLTWQTQQIAAGDFTQRIDFMGEFSEAFNSMVAALAQARDDLTERNTQLADTCEQLKSTQSQLLQQEKMASIGQLAAGVAHEINNPMGFIISNLGSLGKYAEKLTAYLAVDEKVLSGCDPAIGKMAAQERQKYKIDMILKDMPDLISESSNGAQRVRQIVQDLKSFSRVDGGEFASTDINDGLESTISIIWNELKNKTTVTREYGQLPHVWCNAGQLNQVFLNILLNAAHAIVDHGEIRIATTNEDGLIRIIISDSGCGIPPENLKRIFDPFFTTKEVGKGTGLGLSIAYDIVVNKHGGRITVTSEEGVGTTFTIMLPT